jgi:flagellar biosynthesis/type III secretory pathway M-ring protein FliF/YscJ
MKTKGIPAVVMLLAGLVTCIIGIVQHMETMVFTKTLLAVLVIFYVLGCIVKLVLDKNFKEMDEPEKEQEESGEEQEQSDSDGENKSE